MSSKSRHDAVIIGAGHNGLVAATLLARAGLSVLVLERGPAVGGAAVSGSPFPGVDVRLSRYSYLVSLFPAALARALGLQGWLRRRTVSSYTPRGREGLLVLDGEDPPVAGWRAFYDPIARVAQRAFPTVTEPLRSRAQMRALVAEDAVWHGAVDSPLSELLERTVPDDLARGVILTDATIGTFAAADDPQLRQNRCFLYHVIGNGTGHWDVPIGGMGALTDALRDAALAAGAQILTRSEVTRAWSDGREAEVECAGGRRFAARHLLANAAPAVLDGLLDRAPSAPRPEGSQLKINLVVSRLPRLRDPNVTPELAFAGTFHVNEGYEQLAAAYRRAAVGELPDPVPCELYCHSLSDPTILSPELRAAGAQTLTVFALHMPARLFDSPGAKERAVAATIASIDSVLAEPLEECLLRAPDGRACLEALTPPELEAELAMPGGHIFHRDLSWPFTDDEQAVGRWGVETEIANVWLCGAGATRGGGVSGIPGHNAARAVLQATGGRGLSSARG